MNLFCEEIHKLEAEFKQCRKLLKKVVEEIVERKNGDRMQRNMPYFVRLVVDYFYDRMRKTKNLQYGDRTQNHGQYKTHIQRFELIRPGQFYFDACYNPFKTAFLKNAEKKGCKILNGLGMSSSRGLLRSNYGPDRRLHWM